MSGITPNRLNARSSTDEVVYTKNQSDKIQTDPNLQLVVALPSPVSSTPLKQNPKKRSNSAINKPEQRPELKKHRPQLLHEDCTPEIFTPKPHARRNFDRSKSLKPLSKHSNDVEIGQPANKSCKRALNFDLENKERCKILEDNENQGLNLDLEIKQGEQFDVKYQRRKKRKGIIGLNMETSESARCTEMDSLSAMDGSVPLSKDVLCDFIKSESHIQRVSSRLREILMKETGCEHLLFRVYSRKVEVKQCLEHNNESGGKFTVMHKKEKTRSQRLTVSRSWLGEKTAEDFVDVVIIKLESLTISENHGEEKMQNENVESLIVSCEQTFDLVKKQNLQALVNIDEESERVYNMLMSNGGNSFDEEAEANPEKKEYWAAQRALTRDRVDSFMSTLRQIQGDRSFSQWKGSVLDSIVGAYLTQNVTDIASSSAFMSLAARYPAQNDYGKSKYLEQNVIDPSGGKDQVSSGGCILEQVRTCESMSNQSKFKSESVSIKDKDKDEQKKGKNISWDNLRKYYSTGRARDHKTTDALDWEAVRQANVVEVADTIEERGMNNVLAKKIKEFLNRVVEDHGSLDLEWLRDVPPEDTKDFLMSIYGIGLKSTECIRLLTLHHVAFPVDTNVGRVAVRLGWVPLKPLPEGLQMHLLETYPWVNSIQTYLYPRLCNLDQQTLYELHYHLITFGKVFCTKKKPNCNACPMKGECKHFASATASHRLALPARERKNVAAAGNHVVKATLLELEFDDKYQHQNLNYESYKYEPLIELPASPPHELEDIEDLFEDSDHYSSSGESDDDILTIRLDSKVLSESILESASRKIISTKGDTSETSAISDLLALTPMPILKLAGRLMTVHKVFELPDSHPILEGVDSRDPDDPSPYLFAVWEDEGVLSSKHRSLVLQNSEDCRSPKSEVCREIVCCRSAYSNIEKQRLSTISGTLMIPVRSANRGTFPLNGTYFQINEVFADDESTQTPIDIPRRWLLGLPKRFLYCGRTTTTTFKGLSIDLIQHAFSKGFFCTRGFNRRTSKVGHVNLKLSGGYFPFLAESRMARIPEQYLGHSFFSPTRDQAAFRYIYLMAGTSSSSYSYSCQHKKLKLAERPHFQDCGACQDFIYAGATSALFCKECKEYFHEFCLNKPEKDIKFKFAGEGQQIKLSLTKVASTTPGERCEACEDPLTGLTRYSNGEYNVHPECAVNLVPAQINKEGSNGVSLHRALPKAQGVNCMICKKVDNYNWSYVITEGTVQSGCHLHCLREKLIIDDDDQSEYKDVNLKKYFETVGTPNGGLEKFIRGAARILTVASSFAPPPINGIVTQGVKYVEDESVKIVYNY
ncbi:hypothetical protein POM88_021719 [Heracleum sosnowskyi]|uniref:HhH-GPD domain-containing protein n=1 Tax=Heracleum sosnowskyi TaxID=360622 RepID=A0AAD8IFD9_9APIA|nr:hypothetical protein POM88_021719 [Heracleum sosnowskyi]